MPSEKHLSTTELEARIELVFRSPNNEGTLEMIVRRPRENERELLETGHLNQAEGLVGDNWKKKPSKSTPDGGPNPEMQITIMNSRLIALLAGDRARWALAGDQLYVDLDLSVENLPAGTRLAMGSAILEVTSPPHTGCQKFVERFGVDAMSFVNSPRGRNLNLRGVNAKVVKPGEIRVGDLVKKLQP